MKGWVGSHLHEGPERRNYYVISDGTLAVDSTGLLVRCDGEDRHIPVAVVDQITSFGRLAVEPEAFSLLSRSGVRLCMFNGRGRYLGAFTPDDSAKSSELLLKQALLYANNASRLLFARTMEQASLENMGKTSAILGARQSKPLAIEASSRIAAFGRDMDDSSSIEGLMLIEAKARRSYYGALSSLVENPDFRFVERSKRPPRDEINAMLSFGNALLYGCILRIVHDYALSPKIGVVHATNRRDCSLNLDFADIFKPMLVDEVVLRVVNSGMVEPVDFEHQSDGGVMLAGQAKRVFIDEFERNLEECSCGASTPGNNRRLVAESVRSFSQALLLGTEFHPYRR